ncbi:MAG: transporter substrate-binding domain-containing protein [Bacteroidia bacterium]|nr:transporter substrate-binding domain-containing protein [Bacteroidia bacterium]
MSKRDSFYVILSVFLLIASSGCRLVMNKIGESDCAPDGYVADQDTVISCSLGDFKMGANDTFYMEKGKGVIGKFKLNCSNHQISPSTTLLSVGMEPDAPPMYFLENGRETGFDYELLKKLAKNVFPNAQIRVNGHPYDELPTMLMRNEIDIIGGGYVADNQLKGVDWTEPYLSYGYCLITNLGKASTITSLADLKGKKVGVYDDGEAENWVKKNVAGVGEVITAVDDENTVQSDWMTMLVNREVDAIVYDFPFAAKELKDYRGELVITNKRLNAPSDLKAYSFGIPCGNTQTLIAINEAIIKFKSSPEYANLVARFIPNPDEGKTPAEIPADLKDTKTVYQVKSGETLSMIAQRELGDIGRYKELFDLNKDRLASPDIIYVGTLLKMPPGWKKN